jgi:hypothetical protein
MATGYRLVIVDQVQRHATLDADRIRLAVPIVAAS